MQSKILSNSSRDVLIVIERITDSVKATAYHIPIINTMNYYQSTNIKQFKSYSAIQYFLRRRWKKEITT